MKPTYDHAIDTTENVVRENKVFIIRPVPSQTVKTFFKVK